MARITRLWQKMDGKPNNFQTFGKMVKEGKKNGRRYKLETVLEFQPRVSVVSVNAIT